MARPTPEDIGRAVQTLAAVAGLDAKTWHLREITVTPSELSVERFIVGISGRPILNEDRESVYSVIEHHKIAMEIPDDNPWFS